jgi:hypothetical protein
MEVLSFVRPSRAAVVIIGSPTMAHGSSPTVGWPLNLSISSSIHGSQASTVNPDRDTDRSSRSTGSLPWSQRQPQSRRTPSSLPLTYNPAAPAAPKAIEHREKTPPPEDGAENPLMSTAIADQGQICGVPYQYSGDGFSGPLHHPLSPQRQVSLYSQNLQNQFAATPTSATVPPPACQVQDSTEAYHGSAGYTPPGMGMYTPSFPIASIPSSYNSVAPPGGFAQHDYSPGLRNTKPLMMDYSIHSQVYRPTEEEAAVKTKPIKPRQGSWRHGREWWRWESMGS